VFLSGFDENGAPLTMDSIMQDISSDHANKYVWELTIGSFVKLRATIHVELTISCCFSLIVSHIHYFFVQNGDH
jgi:hypothetical protein